MSSRIFKKSVLSLVILATASLPVSQSWAEENSMTAESTDSAATVADRDMKVNVLEGIQETDEATLQKSAVAQADQIKQIAGELRAEGIPVTAEQEAQLNQVSDKLNAEANKPGLKARMIADLKKSEKEGKKGGIIVLSGIGWGGEAALGISLSPFAFGTDMFSAMISGKGVFTSGENGLPAIGGELGGLATLYYVMVGLDAIGVTFEGPLLAAGLPAALINALVCPDNLAGKSAELKQYCEVNSKIFNTLLGGSAKGGQIVGDEAHKGIVSGSRWVLKPFTRFRKKKPAAAPSAAPSPAASLAPSSAQ